MDGIRRDIAEAVRVLRAGGVIAYPTETFYGLGVLPERSESLARLWALKERPQRGPISLLLPRSPELAELGLARLPLPPAFEPLASRFWPGPLTLVVDARDALDRRLVGGDGGVAVRVSSHPVALALLEALGGPLTATSANFRGEPPAATTAEILASGLAAKLDFVLEAGQTPGDKPSTVLRLWEGRATILREGAVPRALLEPALSLLSIALA